MARLVTLSLPGVPIAAASSGEAVWCGFGDRLLAFDPSGSPRLEAPAPEGLRSLAAAGDTLVAALDPGVVAWLDPHSGRVLHRSPVGGEPVVVAGGGAVWVVDFRSARAWRVERDGALVGPVPLGAVDRIAPDGKRIWWTSPGDTLLRGGDRPVELGAGSGEVGGMVACAGSIWLSVAGGLLRVGAWAADQAQRMAAPLGPVLFLACAGGALVGGGGQGMFVIDPSVDADFRLIEADVGGDLAFLVATRTLVWAIPAGRSEARIVTVREGG